MQIIFKKIKNTKITFFRTYHTTSVSDIIVLKENFKIIRSNFTDYKKVNRREIIGHEKRVEETVIFHTRSAFHLAVYVPLTSPSHVAE